MLEIILVILALLAIAGACIYFYMEMKDHKATNTTDFEKINKNIEEEEKTRLGNIKYVVDQVNNTNEAMDKEYTDRLYKIENTGFGALISASSPITGETVAFKDATTASNLKLMKDVSVIGSMSIKDLQTGTKTFQACGSGSGATQKCIKFPDSDGNTYLTGLSEGKNVVSGSLFKANLGAEVSESLKTDTINNLTNGQDLTIQTINGGTVGNTITLGSAQSGGITITSGTSSIVIKNDSININTADETTVGITDADKATALGKIKINNKPLVSISVPPVVTGNTELSLAQLTAFAGKRVLTY